MTKELADLTLQFLQRIQLSAQEIPAYLAVKQALESVQDVVVEREVETGLASKWATKKHGRWYCWRRFSRSR